MERASGASTFSSSCKNSAYVLKQLVPALQARGWGSGSVRMVDDLVDLFNSAKVVPMTRRTIGAVAA